MDNDLLPSPDLGARIVAALGEPAARELLDVLTRSEADRTALIGGLHQRDDARWPAEVLSELEVDGIERLQVADALRRALQATTLCPSTSYRFTSRPPVQ